MHYLYATIESYKIKLGPWFVCKEDTSILGGQNSSMFWMFHSLHTCALPRSELGYADRVTHCGMVPNGVVGFDRIPAHVITRDWNISMKFWYRLQLRPILTIIYLIREMESVMVLQFVKILQFSKVLISLAWTQFKLI